MATVSITYGNPHLGRPSNKVMLPTWLAMPNGDVGEAFKVGEYNDGTVQFTGTFGTGGSVTLRGSNMPEPDVATAAHWFTMTDAQGNAITKTSAAGEVQLEAPLWISPIITAGDGTTAINVYMKCKKD